MEEKLREAACVGDEVGLRILLNQNVNVNSQNPINGWTALHWAYKRGQNNIVRILLESGADKTIKNNMGELPNEVSRFSTILDQLNTPDELGLQYIPNYLRHPPLNGPINLGCKIRTKPTDFGHMQTTSLPASQTDDVILKIRIHGSCDPDFIEIEIPKWKLTFNNLLKMCCEELVIDQIQVERIRKLPNTRLRNDNDVKRLKDNESLEIVLKTPLRGDKPTSSYQSVSSCKDQTILY